MIRHYSVAENLDKILTNKWLDPTQKLILIYLMERNERSSFDSDRNAWYLLISIDKGAIAKDLSVSYKSIYRKINTLKEKAIINDSIIYQGKAYSYIIDCHSIWISDESSDIIPIPKQDIEAIINKEITYVSLYVKETTKDCAKLARKLRNEYNKNKKCVFWPAYQTEDQPKHTLDFKLEESRKCQNTIQRLKSDKAKDRVDVAIIDSMLQKGNNQTELWNIIDHRAKNKLDTILILPQNAFREEFNYNITPDNKPYDIKENQLLQLRGRISVCVNQLLKDLKTHPSI